MGLFPNASKAREFRVVSGGVTAPQGYTAAGVHCGIKRTRKDLALIFSERPAAGAGVFTRNRVKGAPLTVTAEHLEKGPVRAIVANSGIANVCNGPQGLADAREMAELAAQALGLKPHEALVASTGVIGEPLPMDKVRAGIAMAARTLSKEGGGAAAEAILTTDTRTKEIAVEWETGGGWVRLGGIAKGSGMIHPDMATMLAFLTTDAEVDEAPLRAILKRVVDRSFNMLTVDGDTSTNDMVLLLANGRSGVRLESEEELAGLEAALTQAAVHLTREMARDGEGATKLVEVRVSGAASEEDARAAAKAIAGSSLVKTAVYGEDAYWGRVLAAVGYSGAEFDPGRVQIAFGDLTVAVGGQGIAYDDEQAAAIMREPEIRISVDLGSGSASAVAWTCDLTYDYVKINSGYRT